jgi:hypothetical protein
MSTDNAASFGCGFLFALAAIGGFVLVACGACCVGAFMVIDPIMKKPGTPFDPPTGVAAAKSNKPIVNDPPQKAWTPVTRENYNKIKNGMTVQQVQEILGFGKEDSRSGPFLTLSWQHANTIVVITFQDGQVTAKSILGD